jgi:hypothetical protein
MSLVEIKRQIRPYYLVILFLRMLKNRQNLTKTATLMNRNSKLNSLIAPNSLYVAIYALRKALEPGLRRGAVSRYIKRELDSYKLIIDDNLWIDFLEFLKYYWEGKDSIVRGNERGAVQSYERALRVCRRPFLADSTLDLPAEVEVTRHRLQRFLHEMAWRRGAWKHKISLPPSAHSCSSSQSIPTMKPLVKNW